MKIRNTITGSPVSGAGVPANSERLSCEETAEIMRKKSLYRELILSGSLVLPHDKAAQLLGPDCLYHLYAVSKGRGKTRKRRRPPPR